MHSDTPLSRPLVPPSSARLLQVHLRWIAHAQPINLAKVPPTHRPEGELLKLFLCPMSKSSNHRSCPHAGMGSRGLFNLLRAVIYTGNYASGEFAKQIVLFAMKVSDYIFALCTALCWKLDEIGKISVHSTWCLSVCCARDEFIRHTVCSEGFGERVRAHNSMHTLLAGISYIRYKVQNVKIRQIFRKRDTVFMWLCHIFRWRSAFDAHLFYVKLIDQLRGIGLILAMHQWQIGWQRPLGHCPVCLSIG